MYNLLINESIKISKRVRTWVMVGLLLLAVLLQGLIINHFAPAADPDWKAKLTTQTQELEKSIDDPKTPDFLKESLKTNIQQNHYYLDHDINPNQSTGLKFASQATALSVLVTVFSVIVAGDSLASEFSQGTIKLLLIRPVTRTRIYFGKWLTSVLFSWVLLVVLFLFSWLFGSILFGFGGVDQPYVYSNADGIHQITMIKSVLQSYLFSLIDLTMIVTISFMISAVFRSSAMAIATSIVLLFTGNVIVQALHAYSWDKYILFANLDLSQYFTGSPLIESMTLGFSITVLVVYFVVFQLIGWLTFRTRDVTS